MQCRVSLWSGPKQLLLARLSQKVKYGNVEKKKAGKFCYLSSPTILMNVLNHLKEVIPHLPLHPLPPYAGAAICETIW